MYTNALMKLIIKLDLFFFTSVLPERQLLQVYCVFVYKEFKQEINNTLVTNGKKYIIVPTTTREMTRNLFMCSDSHVEDKFDES